MVRKSRFRYTHRVRNEFRSREPDPQRFKRAKTFHCKQYREAQDMKRQHTEKFDKVKVKRLGERRTNDGQSFEVQCFRSV